MLSSTKQGTKEILKSVNEFNELLYDWVIPHLFKLIREKQLERIVESEVKIYANELNRYVFLKAIENVESAGLEDMASV